MDCSRIFYDNSPEYIRSALESFLRNLGTDYIDLYQVHYRDGKTPLAVVVETLEKLKKEGKIRCYGLSNIHEGDYEEIKPFIGMFVSVQDEYSLACRKNEKELKTLSTEFRMTPFTWGSLGQGILTGKYDRRVSFGPDDRRSRGVYVNFHGAKLLRNLDIVEVMKIIAEARRKPVSAVAIRFILDWIKDSVVLAGAKRSGQIAGDMEGTDWQLTEEELQTLDRVSRDPGLVGGYRRSVIPDEGMASKDAL